jgi:hypothetical protein
MFSPCLIFASRVDYRIAVQETALSVNDCMIQAFSAIKLGILLSRVEFKNSREAMEVFKMAAVQYKLPAGFYFYGTALIYGKGGVIRDIPRGIAMLNEAASAGISEAYFQLGAMYEIGVDGAVLVDLSEAREFYEAAIHCCDAEKKQTDNLMMGFSRILQSNRRKMPDPSDNSQGHWVAEISAIKDLLLTEGWLASEGILVNVVGERFNWGLAGQAFLFGAAVVLTQNPQAQHYPALLPIIPAIGMILATFAILQTMEVIWRNSYVRVPLRRMINAKLEAFGKILKVEDGCLFFFPPFHYIPIAGLVIAMWMLRLTEWAFRFRNRLKLRSRREKIRTRVTFLKTWGSTLSLRVVAGLIEFMVLFIALAFFCSWALLLLDEIGSKESGCSDWRYNTCQGSSVECRQKLACDVPPPTPFPTFATSATLRPPPSDP